jgi:hypothetical protein
MKDILVSTEDKTTDLASLDYIEGEWDCEEGVTPQAGRSESYYKGYAARYAVLEASCQTKE